MSWVRISWAGRIEAELVSLHQRPSYLCCSRLLEQLKSESLREPTGPQTPGGGGEGGETGRYLCSPTGPGCARCGEAGPA